LGRYAGRLAAGGAVLGGLAFAMVLMSRLDRPVHEEPAKVVGPAAAPAVNVPAPPKSDTRIAASGMPRTVRPIEAVRPGDDSLKNTEVRVFAALHRIGADLGEPVEVTVKDGRVVVGGAGLPPERQIEIRDAITGEADVAIRFSDSATRVENAAMSTSIAAGRSPLETRLRAWAGAQEAYENLSNRLLDESDNMLAHAHALEALAQRFGGSRAVLHVTELASLDSMAAEHRAAFDEHARNVLHLVNPAAKAMGAPEGKTAASGRLEAAQRMDRALSTIFGSARTDLSTDGLLAELANASASLAAIVGARP
jgi:hypothetical protein